MTDEKVEPIPGDALAQTRASYPVTIAPALQALAREVDGVGREGNAGRSSTDTIAS